MISKLLPFSFLLALLALGVFLIALTRTSLSIFNERFERVLFLIVLFFLFGSIAVLIVAVSLFLVTGK